MKRVRLRIAYRGTAYHGWQRQQSVQTVEGAILDALQKILNAPSVDAIPFQGASRTDAGVHALGSMIVFVLMGTPVLLTLLIVAAEWIVHFHIDWAKARRSMCKQHTPSEAGYWRATGADQFGHQLTYLAMAWAWWMWAA